MKNRDLLERFHASFTPNYRPAEIAISHGEGMEVVDVEGRRFLDMISGIAVSALGHGHPALVQAVAEQAAKVLHTSNLYMNVPSIELAELLVEHSFAECVYFCNSGAEANEASIKLARRYHYDREDRDRVEIVSFSKSFHGRTFAALTATAQPKYHAGFTPLPGGFRYVDWNDGAAVGAAIGKKTAAVIVEPMQGEGGVRLPPAGFLAGLRKRCDDGGALLIFDEVQVGVGRTGLKFCYEHEGVVPDIMSLAKGVGGGLPLGAMVATRAVGHSLAYGTHATTYGGNPVACAAGKVVLKHVCAPGFLEHATEMGARLKEGLIEIGNKHGVFADVRGRGLLIGAELREDVTFDAKAIVVAVREHGVLVHIAGPRVLRLAPPLILQEAHVERALTAIDRGVGAAARGPT